MYVRLFDLDGSFKDGKLIYEKLKEGEWKMTFEPGLPAGILPSHVVRLEDGAEPLVVNEEGSVDPDSEWDPDKDV